MGVDWCNGPAKALKEFTEFDCKKYKSAQSCVEAEEGKKICFPLIKGDNFNCFNIISLCTSSKTKEKCSETEFKSAVCEWINFKDTFYNSQCVPSLENLKTNVGGSMKNLFAINIGTDCMKGTGCYQGCGYKNKYRSSELNIMGGEGVVGEGFSNYQRKIICEIMENLTGGAGGDCNKFWLTPKSLKKENVPSTPPSNENKTSENCDGCFSNERCYPLGYRKGGDYCSEDNTFISQTRGDNNCSNNFECGSNLCVNSSCVSEGLLQKILSWFSRLFG